MPRVDKPIAIQPHSSGATPTLYLRRNEPFAVGARRGSTLWIVIASIVIVGLAAISIASTLFAIQAVEERDRAKASFAQSSDAVGKMVRAVAASSKLKGASADKDRQAILQPAVEYYGSIVEEYKDDEEMKPELVSAQLYQASLQAKLGMKDCTESLGAALTTLSQMVDSDFSEEAYPSFQDHISQVAAPTDWMTVKDSTPMAQGVGLYAGLQAGSQAYRNLSKKFPESLPFRRDLVELLKNSALLLGFIRRDSLALKNWREARDVLETMVRDKPDDTEYQELLAESLANIGKMEGSAGKADESIAAYTRAVEVRQKLADANPDDKSMATALARAQRDLERAETAKKEAPADDKQDEGEVAAKPAPDDSESAAPADDDTTPEEASKDGAK